MFIREGQFQWDCMAQTSLTTWFENFTTSMCTIEGLEIVQPNLLCNVYDQIWEHRWRCGGCDFRPLVYGWHLFVKILHTSHMHTCKAQCCGSLAHLWGGEKIIFAMLHTHDECLQAMHIDSRARVMTLVRSRLYVVTSMTRDSHKIRTCECILRHDSL